MSFRTQVQRLRHVAESRSRTIGSLHDQLRDVRAENAALHQEVAALELEVGRLRIETFTDPLTGLYNRTGLRHIWAEIAPDVTGVMAIDSDYFKMINDRYGHSTGDSVICHIGETIRACGIIAARTGGDEYIGLTMDEDPEKIAEHLRQAMSIPRTINGHEITSTVTIGLCLTGTAPVDHLSTYLDLADDVLYQGKRAGRNTVTTTTAFR